MDNHNQQMPYEEQQKLCDKLTQLISNGDYTGSSKLLRQLIENNIKIDIGYDKNMLNQSQQIQNPINNDDAQLDTLYTGVQQNYQKLAQEKIRQMKIEQEARRKREEELRRQQQEAIRKQKEEELKRQQEEELKRQQEEARRQQEEARRKQEEEARRREQEIAQKKQQILLEKQKELQKMREQALKQPEGDVYYDQTIKSSQRPQTNFQQFQGNQMQYGMQNPQVDSNRPQQPSTYATQNQEFGNNQQLISQYMAQPSGQQNNFNPNQALYQPNIQQSGYPMKQGQVPQQQNQAGQQTINNSGAQLFKVMNQGQIDLKNFLQQICDQCGYFLDPSIIEQVALKMRGQQESRQEIEKKYQLQLELKKNYPSIMEQQRIQILKQVNTIEDAKQQNLLSQANQTNFNQTNYNQNQLFLQNGANGLQPQYPQQQQQQQQQIFNYQPQIQQQQNVQSIILQRYQNKLEQQIIVDICKKKQNLQEADALAQQKILMKGKIFDPSGEYALLEKLEKLKLLMQCDDINQLQAIYEKYYL